MSTPVLTALGALASEPAIIADFARRGGPVTVVRRCLGVTDLLAASEGGSARAALVSGELRGLDSSVVARLAAAGLTVVGLAVTPEQTQRLRAWGVLVLPADSSPAVVAAALAAPPSALAEPVELAHWQGSPMPGADLRAVSDGPAEQSVAVEPGRLVAVWGPVGAPGRSTVAINLAAEIALLGRAALLVDVDTYGASLAQQLGILDEAAGLVAAARDAQRGELDATRLTRHIRTVPLGGAGSGAHAARLGVLTGLTRADRWPELRPGALGPLLAAARIAAEVTVADCGFCLEADDELEHDLVTPRRNGAALRVLASADAVVAVAAAEPVGLARLLRALPELRSRAPDAELVVVVNRVRPGPVRGNAGAEIVAALARFGAVHDIVLLSDDRPGLDGAVADGRLLAEHSPRGVLRREIALLARHPAITPAATPSVPGAGSGRRHRSGRARTARVVRPIFGR